METEHGQVGGSSASAVAAPPAPTLDYEHRPPPRRTPVGRAGAVTKWFLVVPFVLMAPLALIIWSAMPRVASPEQLAAAAVDSGLTETARAAMIDELAAQLAEERGAPLTAGTIREVFDRSITQEWFDEQLTSMAGEVDRWLAGDSHRLPGLTIDLVPVKTALASDPEAMSLVASMVSCEGEACAAGISAVPDEAELLSIDGGSTEAEDLRAARGLLQNSLRLRQFAPLVLLAELAVVVLLARRHARLRFAGGVVLAVGALTMLVVVLTPSWLGGEAAGAVPEAVSLAAQDVAAVVAWSLAPARTVAWWLLAAGAAALAGSFVWDAVSRRSM